MIWGHSVYKFKLLKFHLVTKVGKEGTGVREFSYPRYLTVNTDRSVLVADYNNDRIVVMDGDLKHKRYIKHQTMAHLLMLKLTMIRCMS